MIDWQEIFSVNKFILHELKILLDKILKSDIKRPVWEVRRLPERSRSLPCWSAVPLVLGGRRGGI